MLDDEKFLEALIRDGRTGPDDAQVERLEQRLEPCFRSAHQPSTKAPWLPGLKVFVATLGIGLLVSGVATREALLDRDEPPPVVTKVEAPIPTIVPALAEPAATIPEPESVPVEAPRPIRVAVKPQVEAAPSAPTKAPAPAPTTPTVVAAQVAPEEASEAVAAVSSNQLRDADEESVSPSPEVAPSAPSARAPSGESEVTYLRRAQAALSSNPQRALTLADEHPSRYPDAVLTQEREVIAIDALVKLRRVAEARTRAAAFRVRYPSSAHLARVVSAVGDVP